MHAPRLRAAPASLALLCASCSTISTGLGYITGSTQEKEEEVRVSEVQAKVMRYADDYASQVVQAASRVDATTAEKRLAVVGWQLRQSTAAYEIATGPNPLLSAVDLVVLATLTRATVEEYWVPVVFGETGRPLLATCQDAEKQAWVAILPLLQSLPQNKLRDAIAKWRAKHPDVHEVSSIRLVDVEKDQDGGAQGLGTPGSVLASVGLDPLGKLEPAVQQVERTRILAERALYYAKRWPSLLDLQAQQLALQLSLQPQSQDVLRDAARISSAAEAVGKLAGDVPSLVDREREAAIRQFLDAAQAREGEARALLAEAKSALDAGQGAFKSADGAIRSLQSLVSMVSAPSTPGTPPAKPFDVNDYTRGLVELGKAMNDARALVESVEKGAPRLEALVQRATRGASDDGRALVDYAFRRGLALVGVLLAGILAVAVLYRVAAARIGARAAQAPKP